MNNSKDIVANSISVLKGSRTIDVLETIDALSGLAPATLNSLDKLADALNNDSVFFTTVTTALGNKADKSTTYTRLVTNDLLDAKVDDTEMANYATKLETYTKTEVTQKFTDLVDGAPVLLNTLKELSDALGADKNFSTTITNTLSNKADSAVMGVLLDAKANQSTTYTKGEVNAFLNGKPDDAELTVMLIGINEQIDAKAPIEGPTFTGTATISGDLVVGTTNVLNAINNISLTPGPTGATGATGAQGIQGLTGATGATGQQVQMEQMVQVVQ